MGKITIPASPTTPNKSVNEWLETLREAIQVEVDKLDALDDYAVAQAEAAIQEKVGGFTLQERATAYMQKVVDDYAASYLAWGGVQNAAYTKVAALYAQLVSDYVKWHYDTWMDTYVETARRTALSFCGDFMNDVKALLAGSTASQRKIITTFSTTVNSDGSILFQMIGIKIMLADGTIVTTDKLELTIPQSEIIRPDEWAGEGNMIILGYNSDGVCKIDSYSYNSGGTIEYKSLTQTPLGAKFWAAGVKARVIDGSTYIGRQWWVGNKPRYGFEWTAIRAGDKWWAPYGEPITQNHSALLNAAYGDMPTIAEGYSIAHQMEMAGETTPFLIGETYNGTLVPAVMVPEPFPTMRAFVEGTDSLQKVIRIEE